MRRIAYLDYPCLRRCPRFSRITPHQLKVDCFTTGGGLDDLGDVWLPAPDVWQRMLDRGLFCPFLFSIAVVLGPLDLSLRARTSPNKCTYLVSKHEHHILLGFGNYDVCSRTYCQISLRLTSLKFFGY